MGDIQLKRIGRRKWIRLWVDDWFDSTSRWSLTTEQRAFWVDLLALAGRSRWEGCIAAGEDSGQLIGFPVEYLAGLLRTTPTTVKETLDLFVQKGRIVLYDAISGPIIQIVNWGRYQANYEKQRKYRNKKKMLNTTNAVTAGLPRKLPSVRPIEVEVKKEKEKKEGEENKTRLAMPCQEALQTLTPEAVFSKAKRIFRKHCGKTIGSLGPRKRDWDGLIGKHGADVILRAIDIWAGELKANGKNLQWPLAVFLNQREEYIEAAQDSPAQTEPEGDEDPTRGIPTLADVRPKVQL